MATYKLGLDGKLMLLSTGSAITGGQDLSNVTDVKLSISIDEADATTRANQAWTNTQAGLKTAELTFSVLYDPADTAYTTFRQAMLNKTTPILAVLTHTNGDGPIAKWSVTQFDLDQTLKEVQKIDVTCKMADFKAWRTASTGT